MTKEEIEKFVDCVNIKQNNGEDCEIEVSEKAIEFYYKKYPCYNSWKIEETKKSKNKEVWYMGSYELKNNNNYILTADILTSIKSPINMVLRKYHEETFDKKKHGKEIKKIITDNDLEENNFNILKNNDLLPYLKAFAYVYYWIGNMMPVVSNPTSGVRNVDNWNTKLNIILSLFNNEKLSVKTPWKAKWSGWISTEWKDKRKGFCSFCEENYLQDLYSMNEKNDPVVKDIVEGCNSIVISLEKEIIKKWFDNNTKIIIQRSYRIKNKFKEDWNAPDKKDDKENVKCIIKDVYKKAGFPGTEDINLFEN